MQTIRNFSFAITGGQVQVPGGTTAPIRAVLPGPSSSSVTVAMEIDTAADPAPRTFHVAVAEVDTSGLGSYIGSARLSAQAVAHVFEVV